MAIPDAVTVADRAEQGGDINPKQTIWLRMRGVALKGRVENQIEGRSNVRHPAFDCLTTTCRFHTYRLHTLVPPPQNGGII